MAWDDDGTLVTDPQREVSLIWYGNRGGLEDRVPHQDRAVQRHQPAGAAHLAQHQQCRDPGAAGWRLQAALQLVHAELPVQADRHLFRNVVLHARHVSGEQPLIKNKKVVLKNDYIHHVIDIYTSDQHSFG